MNDGRGAPLRSGVYAAPVHVVACLKGATLPRAIAALHSAPLPIHYRRRSRDASRTPSLLRSRERAKRRGHFGPDPWRLPCWGSDALTVLCAAASSSSRLLRHCPAALRCRSHGADQRRRRLGSGGSRTKTAGRVARDHQSQTTALVGEVEEAVESTFALCDRIPVATHGARERKTGFGSCPV